MALKEADFQLQFIDSFNTATNDTDHYWRLIDMTNNDTINADRILDRALPTGNHFLTVAVSIPTMVFRLKLVPPLFGLYHSRQIYYRYSYRP